jgi:branched-chain amino acid transport system ATP-binding protein
MKVLEVKEVTAGYDKEIDVLRNISLFVEGRESVSLIGANGAGKSTLLKTISGLVHPKKGKILYGGERIEKLEPHQVVDRGIIQIPEEKETFATLTVAENLRVVCQTTRSKEKKTENLAFVLETFPVLADRKNQEAQTLSGGERKMLAVGMSMMAEPRMMLLDDISVGLAPKVVGLLYDRLEQLRDLLKIPILMVEQNVEIALDFTERGYVISGGEIVLTGTAEELRNAQEVKESYLGT